MDVMMISRHRQWRAWQFGRRHSGLFSGRGTSSYGTGGGDGGGMDFDGFLKLKWWGRTVFVVLALGFGVLCYLRLLLFAPLAWFPPVLLADAVLDMVLPDGDDGPSRTMEERKRNLVVWGLLTVLSVVALVSPEHGLAVFFLLLLLMFLRWVFG